ncbi:MAG: diguanylate cyclase [Desulfovibrio sp.]|nr:diguanylate cyclase [Desulfovibrio sp.]
MRISRFQRSMTLLILGVLIASLSIFLISHHFMSQGFDRSFRRELAIFRHVVDDIVGHAKTRLFQEANLLSDSHELEQAFLSADHTILTQFAHKAMAQCKANFATIVDARGVVLARGHSERHGDVIPMSSVMRDALAGKSAVDIVRPSTGDIGLSLAAAAPIRQNGTLAGALLFGEQLAKHSFVDEVQRVTGLEMTVFDRNVRISTTIMHKGGRALGTQLENTHILDTVLDKGGVFNDEAVILGKAYKTVYWPIQDSASHIYGMWFIGTEVDGVRQTITAISMSCLLATLLVAAVLSVLGVMLSRSLVNPLLKRAYIDRLTGIANRAGYVRSLRGILENGPLVGGLFIIDLDNFKTLNDTLGHPVGDKCLKRTGGLLKRFFRESDLVARLGGDEFVVYAPMLDSAEVIEEKLQKLQAILRKEYTAADGRTVTITASMGVATCHDGKTAYKKLYEAADRALYTSKRTGRNRYTHVCCLEKKVCDHVPLTECDAQKAHEG